MAGVSLSRMFPGLEHLEAGACLASGVLDCSKDVPQGGKNENYVGLDMQIDGST